MTTTLETDEATGTRRTDRLVGWGLLVGGAVFFAGGPMHPKQDPPGVSLKEHLHVMYEDPAWYPSHAVLLVGVALIAAGLVALVRGGSLRDVRSAHLAAVVAAGASVAAAGGMLLHLLGAADAGRIAAHQDTPLTDVLLVVETITVPVFGLGIAALAVIGAVTRTLGNRLIAVLAVVGGVGYGLAGATVLLTDELDALFPMAGGIGLWAIGVGVGLLRRPQAAGSARPALVEPRRDAAGLRR